MRQEIDKYELIEKYLNGQLSSDEVLAFEKQMSEDNSLSDETARQQELKSFIDDASMLSLKENLQKIHQKHNTKPNPLNGKKWLWGIPIIIILGTAILLLKPEQNNAKSEQDNNNKKENPNNEHIEEGQVKISIANHSIEKEIIQPKEERSIHPQMQNQPIPLETMGSDSAQQQEDEIKLPAALLASDIESIEPEDKMDNTVLEELVKPNPDHIKPEPFDCNNIIIEASVKTEKSCEDKPTGKLFIVPNSIEGGSPPYSVSIKDKAEYNKQLSFNNLYANYYSVYIKDKNNCISHLGNYYIEEVNCNYEAVFAPEKGEIWEIPEQEFPAQLKIFSKTGQIVYMASLEPGIKHEWSGRTKDGSELPMGAYPFIIEPENQKPFWGTITLIR